jgi:hypothetical protein
MTFGNPQCVVLGALPDERRFHALGPAIERHAYFPGADQTSSSRRVEQPDRVRNPDQGNARGPTQSSGTDPARR